MFDQLEYIRYYYSNNSDPDVISWIIVIIDFNQGCVHYGRARARVCVYVCNWNNSNKW